ncbi:MAG: hypothetical protein R3284_08915 [Rubricoccaceae bacterium]|nr:hypothetical protein [Rubricoccaceae bacterium]
MIKRLLLTATFVLASPAIAQTDIVGDWSGVLDPSLARPGASPLTLVFHIAEADSGYSVTLDSPDQGAFGLPFDSASLQGDTLTLAAAAMGATFTGVVSEGQIGGSWKQGPVELPLVLSPNVADEDENAEETTSSDKANVKPGDYTGDWEGIMQLASGGEVRLTFHLILQEDGTYDAAVSAPAQGADHLSVGKATINGKSVTIPVPPASARFVGTFSDDEMSAVGQWQQGGEKLDMTLTRQ